MRNKKEAFLLVLLLFLGIGFATVSTTLYIRGGIHLRPDTEDFSQNVKFASVDIDSGSRTAGTTASISADGKSLIFKTHALKSIGERVTITYTIINESQYKAKLGSLVCSPITSGGNTYLSVIPSNNNANFILNTGATSNSDSIEVVVVRSYGSSTNTEFKYTCNLDVTAQSN